jgi:excisionase family DNA binding protein
MISPDPLERLVEQDTFAEMVSLLKPEELRVATLRLEGLPDSQIAAMLDIDPRTVVRRMEEARQRIIQALPELASFLRNRQYLNRQPLPWQVPPLERGWLCQWDENGEESLPNLDSGMTVRDVARRYGVTRQTVTRWIREGRFPNAHLAGAGRGAYRIPELDLINMQPGRRSRPQRRPGEPPKRTSP